MMIMSSTRPLTRDMRAVVRPQPLKLESLKLAARSRFDIMQNHRFRPLS
ncbi:hypothetical protein I656_02993 [Geobacillus sp. WSUCF1]|nr:hypothetical protein I656_02993 [Geobacillus sp. WSUCF1]